MRDIYTYIDAHADEYIRDLQRLVQQPSVSAQGIGLRECAELVRDMMRADGLDATLYELDGGPPVIFGAMSSPRSSKTLLCYSHYDVQPAEPLDRWKFGPWSGHIEDGILYGRGSTDNKSGVLAFNKAAQAFLRVRGELPLNVKFIIEGEEEIGSMSLGPWVQKNPDLLRADGMHCLDGGINPTTDAPDVELGLKSVFFVELIARGANADIHSLNAPLVPQPAWDLVRALNTIVDANRRILIDDWYDGLYELQDEDWAALEDEVRRTDTAQMKRDWGIREFALGRNDLEALKARRFEPTANIAGLTSGYQGPGSKTIVPNEARAKLDFRLPPHMRADQAREKLRRHLDKHGFSHIEIETRGEVPEPPYKISVKEDISQAVIAAATEVFGKPPTVAGVSAEGTILKHVWIPCVLTGFAQPDCNLHAPNENIHLGHFIRGIKYAAAIMDKFGKT